MAITHKEREMFTYKFSTLIRWFLFAILSVFIVACSNDHGGKHLQISGRVVLETESMEIIPVDDTIHGDVLYYTFVPSIFGGVYCKNYIDFVTDENGFFSIDIPMASTENVYISAYKSFGDTIRYTASNVEFVCPKPDYYLLNQTLILRYEKELYPRIKTIYEHNGNHRGRAPGDSLILTINHSSLTDANLYCEFYPNQYAEVPNNDIKRVDFFNIPLRNTRSFAFMIPDTFNYAMYTRNLVLEYGVTNYRRQKFYITVSDFDSNNYVWNISGKFLINTDSGLVSISKPIHSTWVYQLDTASMEINTNDITDVYFDVESNNKGEFAFQTPKVVNSRFLHVNASVVINEREYSFAHDKVWVGPTSSSFKYCYLSNDSIFMIVRDLEIVME
jgi:hypothetical protein